MKAITEIREEIRSSALLAAQMVQEREKQTLPQYRKGDLVWLEGKNITTTHPTTKLAPKRHGPFEIQEVLGPVTVKLRLPEHLVSAVTPRQELSPHTEYCASF